MGKFRRTATIEIEPIPYEDWIIPALVILVCTAILTFGLIRVIRYQIDTKRMSPDADIIARLILILFCGSLGWIIGWRAWDPWIGMVVGMCGSGGSPIIVKMVLSRWERLTSKRTPI